jgi:hypothetical protein
LNNDVVNPNVNENNNDAIDESDNEPVENDLFTSIFHSSFESNVEFGNSFESAQRSLKKRHCHTCKEISLNLRTENCERCSTFTNNIINPFTADNNMDPGQLPDELKGLSLVEQTLISPVKVFITVFNLTEHGQYGYKGNVINFNQNISELVDQLPRCLSSLSEFVIFRKDNVDVGQFSEVRVRKQKVLDALNKLIEINPLFRNRVINFKNLNQLPDDGSVHEYLTQISIPEVPLTNDRTNNIQDQSSSQHLNSQNDNSHQENNSHVSDRSLQSPNANPSDANLLSQQTDNNNQRIDLINYTGNMNVNLPNIRGQIDEALNQLDQQPNQQQDPQPNVTPVIPFPNLEPGPIDELTPGYIALAFPCLFPFGVADFNQGRVSSVSLLEWIRHMILYYDGRFASDPRFRYFATNTFLRSQSLQKGRVFVQNNSEFANLSREEIIERLRTDQSFTVR